METIPVDESGSTVLAYLDSGAPAEDVYTTLVCVHGHSFHAHNFSRLFPLAQARGLRVIALNRRDYKGSTLFSPSELSALIGSASDGDSDGDGETAQAAFLKDRGLELAKFLVRLIGDKAIPKTSISESPNSSGGIVLLGWSLGAITTLAFLANLRSYPSELVSVLQRCLRAFLIYDLPNNSTGAPPPASGGYHPLEDPSLPPRVRGVAFGTWVSSYYAHPAYASRSRSPSPNDPTALTPPARTIANLDVRAPTYPFRKCTLDTLAPRDLLACVDVAPGARSEAALWSLPSGLLRAQTGHALVLADTDEPQDDVARETETEDELNPMMPIPGLQVRIIHGLASLWSVQWETWKLEQQVADWQAEGRRLRPIDFVPVPDANHFLHWDDPERFLDVCVDAIG